MNISLDTCVSKQAADRSAAHRPAIATELFHNSNPDGAPQTRRIIDSIVVGRLGTPADVARAAVFFLAPDNGFVTGQVLYVCGGTTLGVAPV